MQPLTATAIPQQQCVVKGLKKSPCIKAKLRSLSPDLANGATRAINSYSKGTASTASFI